MWIVNQKPLRKDPKDAYALLFFCCWCMFIFLVLRHTIKTHYYYSGFTPLLLFFLVLDKILLTKTSVSELPLQRS